MDKNLTVYPIPTGDKLNVFAAEDISCIRVMDMEGNVLATASEVGCKQNVVDIRHLPGATYIVEVIFLNSRTGRSVFVKM